MISVYLVGDSEVIARLNAMPGGVQQGLARATTRLSLEGQRLSQQKVSGQVLNVRTGVLRSSINAKPTEVTATGVMGGWGTNIKYARFHEFGVPHKWLIEAKNARVLAFEVNGQTIFRPRVMAGPLPERSFLRSALREMEPRIREEYSRAVGEIVR